MRGFIHCDPHAGNVLVRPGSDGTAQIVLLDHGLYKVRGRVKHITTYTVKGSATKFCISIP